MDFIPPILLLAFIPLVVIGYFNPDESGFKPNADLEAVLSATMILLLWLKFLYFLRIFQETGYLIRIITEVVYDIRHFLLLLLLTIVAFGDSMRSISTSNPAEEQFIVSIVGVFTYVYRMILGDFDTNSFGSIATPYMWLLFILCTIINMIIMLNLLIAIIGESFNKVNEVSVQASY